MPTTLAEILWRKLTWTDLQAMSGGYSSKGGGGAKHVPLSKRPEVGRFFGVKGPKGDESVTYEIDLVAVDGVSESEGPLVLTSKGSRRAGEWRFAGQHNNRYPLWSARWGLREATEFASETVYNAGDPQILLILKDDGGNFHARLLKSYDDGLLAKLPKGFAQTLRDGPNFGVYAMDHQVDLPKPDEEEVDAGHPVPDPSGDAGQGYVSDSAVRNAIELHAMNRAAAYFEDEGWAVTDVSGTHPYDLHCKRADEDLQVEVKGTRGLGKAVFLTHGEVKAARDASPNTALFVVSEIEVEGEPPVASGGTSTLYHPWNVDEGQLESIQFRYIPPDTGNKVQD